MAPTSPPCASTMAATIASPSPAPARPRSRPPSARQKRSNSSSASSVGRPGPWSRTRSRTRPFAVRHRHVDVRARRRVHERVAQQVAEHLAQLVRVAEHGRRSVGGERDLAIGRRRPRVGHRVLGERREVDLAVRRLGDLVEPCERQQVLDEHAHARRLVLDPLHRLVDLLRLARGAHPEQLGVAADRRQRRAQLVRRIGEEAAQPVLGLPLPGERALQPVEHRVQREPQPPHLGARVGGLDALGEVAAGDRAGRMAHAVEREQAHAHNGPGDAAEYEQDREDDERLDRQQPVQPRVDLTQRRRHDRGVAAAHMVGVDPVAVLVTVLAADREHAAQRHGRRELGVGGDVLAVGEHVRGEPLAGSVAQLAVGADREHRLRRAAARRAALVLTARLGAHPLLAHHALDQRQRTAHLVVEPRELERALLDVRDAAEQEQPDRRQREERSQQTGAQGGHHVRGDRSA